MVEQVDKTSRPVECVVSQVANYGKEVITNNQKVVSTYNAIPTIG